MQLSPVLSRPLWVQLSSGLSRPQLFSRLQWLQFSSVKALTKQEEAVAAAVSKQDVPAAALSG